MDSLDNPSESRDDGPTPDPPQSEQGQVDKIQQLLRAKDDTSRFVGLALLKSTLDNSEAVRENKEVVVALWDSISVKFLDRLLKTGAKPGSKQADAREMLDLATNVIYTFSVLLPAEALTNNKLLGRIPRLLEAVLCSSGETTDVILKTLLTLVSKPEGGRAFSAAQDWTPLIEIAPKQPYALAIISWSWLHTASNTKDRSSLRDRIDQTISALIASYKGTDAVTLLDFIDKALGRLDDDLVPLSPQWLGSLIELIRNLATSRPTAAGREAYTNCAARLLITYSDSVPGLLFSNQSGAEDPFSYLLISLIIVDLKATLPSLLSKLNTPEYPAISSRLTSALLILSYFISFLLQQMDAELGTESNTTDFTATFRMAPELLLKLNRSISEALSVIMEYLRDRWDAAVAGAQGLHPETRYGKSHTMAGSHLTLAWDQQNESPAEDPLLLAALRALGEWLREDDGEVLRNEAISLMDLLVELYQTSAGSGSGSIGYRALVLGVLQGVTQTDEGVRSLLDHDGWSTLSKDLLAAWNRTSTTRGTVDLHECELGSQIALLLMALVQSQGAIPEEWLDLVTGIAAYNVPDSVDTPDVVQRLWVDVLQLAADLLAKTPLGIKRRYEHTTGSIRGIAASVEDKITSPATRDHMEEALLTLRQNSI
ncbi:uncharacterized protein PG998_000540 [Apiospora kogelbergensis]|uniref:uncharacterized protein n=1 Tax=Apiospora kogelbergensis TaxID=1337665 RepID=UPI00312D6C1C